MEKKLNILLIDDEESTLRAFENVLLLNGFDCFATSNIRRGLLEFRINNYDYVLLDYQMPVKNGIEVMEDILDINPLTKVIIYTGHTDISIRQNAIIKGAYEFLYKPIDFKEFITLLSNTEKYELEII